MRTALITDKLESEGWIMVGDAGLIVKDYYFDEWDRLVELSDDEVWEFINPYIGTEATIMANGEVYGYDGKYLGEEYD